MNKNKKSFFKTNPFERNGFILGFSILSAIVIWFAVSFSKISDESPRIIKDVPINVKVSSNAVNDGLMIFNQTEKTVDISVKGSASLTADDFIVEPLFDPESTKVSGTSMQKAVISVVPSKKDALKSFEIIETKPSEITVEYDRVKKITLPVENEIKYQIDSGYSASAPSFSEPEVVVTGPESMINKVKRAAVVHDVSGSLKQNVSIDTQIVLYDTENNKITDYNKMYLTLSAQSVTASITVLPKKTVPITLNIINKPEGFSDSRITITPATIDVAASAEKINSIDAFYIDTPIDFTEITASNSSFEMDVPVSSDVKNISNIDKVKVSFNLGGFKEVKLSTSNIKTINAPPGMEIDVITQSLNVVVIGSEAQTAKLTGDSLDCTIDLESLNSSGSVEVPVTVKVIGANSCWVVGKYSVTVNMKQQSPQMRMENGDEKTPFVANP